MTLLITLNGGIKLKRNEIHELNIIFLLLLIFEKFSSAVEYYFNKIVGLQTDVEQLKSKYDEKIGEKDRNLNSKVISRDFI
ncbi:MAG: hypothetical protein E7Z73_09915 [Methanobrevibacter millerae]|uniref:Uncharacterized protein n=1 Tax=Methanobrevibacter millerae TaxID=230361 RepID=A0A8T3VMZ3_9EURY|nr:hypothetical protein [Methanobrevibacter millerae]MBE6506030.1 hypothetical protein [Methanobrevibacter millerae]